MAMATSFVLGAVHKSHGVAFATPSTWRPPPSRLSLLEKKTMNRNNVLFTNDFSSRVGSEMSIDCPRKRQCIVLNADREPRENDDVILSSVDKVIQILSTPTPGFESLALGYPLVLVASLPILPLSTSLAFIAFFAAYLAVGRGIINEPYNDSNEMDDTQDNESKLVDFVALAGALVSAGILAPSGFGLDNVGSNNSVTTDPNSLWSVFPIALVGLAATTFIFSSPVKRKDGNDNVATSLQEDLLHRWDERFQQEERKDKENKT